MYRRFEKQRLRSVSLEEADVAEVPSLQLLTSVGMGLEPLLRLRIAFQKSLCEGLRALKNLFLESLRALVTAFYTPVQGK